MPDSFRDGARSSHSTVLRNLLRLLHPCVPAACRTRQRSTSRRHVPASYTKLRTTHWPEETDPTAKQALRPSAGSGQGSSIRLQTKFYGPLQKQDRTARFAMQTKLYSPPAEQDRSGQNSPIRHADQALSLSAETGQDSWILHADQILYGPLQKQERPARFAMQSKLYCPRQELKRTVHRNEKTKYTQ